MRKQTNQYLVICVYLKEEEEELYTLLGHSTDIYASMIYEDRASNWHS